MGYFSETFAQMAPMLLNNGVVPGLAESRVAFVSRLDVAASASAILLAGPDCHSGAIYNATGPDRISIHERATLLTDLSGKPVRFLPLDEAELRTAIVQSGMPMEYMDPRIDIERSFVAGCFDIVTGDVERLSGHPPRSLRDILAHTLSQSQ